MNDQAAWAEAEGLGDDLIPYREGCACLRTTDGELVFIWREFARQPNGRLSLTPMGDVAFTEWRAKTVATPPPGINVRPVAYTGLTAIEQLFFAETGAQA